MTSVDSSRSVGVYVKNKKRKQPDTLYSLNKKLEKMQKHIFKAMELKAFTYNPSSVGNVDATTGYVNAFMYRITENMTGTTRIGRQIMVKAIQYKIWVFSESTTTKGAGAISFIQDKVPTGTAPTITQLFHSQNPTSYIDYNSKKKFKVLRDHFFEYGVGSVDTNGQAFEGFIKINKVTQYVGNAGTQADLTNGGNDYIVTARSTNASSGSTSYGLVLTVRVFYLDA